jgi:hypothetical protein
MSTTRTLITTIGLTVLLSATAIEAQPSVLAGGSSDLTSTAEALSLDETRETPTDVLRSAYMHGATVYYESPRDILDVIWGLGQYANAGLELPHVNIRLQYRDECKVAGSMWTSANGEYWVKVCAGRMTLLHELGHVWDRHNLDEETRQKLVELRGLQEWKHKTWELAAGEHLAEAMTWALDTEYRLPLRIPNHTEYELNQMYRMATGQNAPILDGRLPQKPVLLDEDDRILDQGDALGAGDTLG